VALFGGEVEPDRYFYHYTTREAALGSILATGQIRFGLIRYVNDPRESKEWLFSFTGGAGHHDLVKLIQQIALLSQSTTKVLCLTRDDPEAISDLGSEDYGRGWAHSRMWASYASGHSGVCLVFEREPLRRSIEETLLGKGALYAGDVTYADYASDEIDAFNLDFDKIDDVGLEIVLADHIETYHPILFFRKNADWATECEYRWLFRNDTPSPEFVPIHDSLRAVIVGHSFPQADRDALDHLVSNFGGAVIGRCAWHNGHPTIHSGEGINMSGIRFWVAGATPPPPPASLRIT
jgi:hypothetical protein